MMAHKVDLDTIMQWSQWLTADDGSKTVAQAMVKRDMNAEEMGQAIDQLVLVTDSTPILRRTDDLFAEIAELAKNDDAAREAVSGMSDQALAKLLASQATLSSMTGQLVDASRVARVLAVNKAVRTPNTRKLKRDDLMNNLWSLVEADEMNVDALWDAFGPTLFAWVIVEGLIGAQEQEEDEDGVDHEEQVTDRDVIMRLPDAIAHPEDIGDMQNDAASILAALYESSIKHFSKAYRLAQMETPSELEESLWLAMERLMEDGEAGDDASVVYAMVAKVFGNLF